MKSDELIITSANNEKPTLRFLIKNGKDASFVSFDIKEDVLLTGKKSFYVAAAVAQPTNEQLLSNKRRLQWKSPLIFFPIKPNFKHICQNYDSSNRGLLDEQ